MIRLLFCPATSRGRLIPEEIPGQLFSFPLIPYVLHSAYIIDKCWEGKQISSHAAATFIASCYVRWMPAILVENLPSMALVRSYIAGTERKTESSCTSCNGVRRFIHRRFHPGPGSLTRPNNCMSIHLAQSNTSIRCRVQDWWKVTAGLSQVRESAQLMDYRNQSMYVQRQCLPLNCRGWISRCSRVTISGPLYKVALATEWCVRSCSVGVFVSFSRHSSWMNKSKR